MIINLVKTLSGMLEDYDKGFIDDVSFTHVLDRIIREYNDYQQVDKVSKNVLFLFRKDNVDLNVSNKKIDRLYRKKYDLVQEHLIPISELSRKLRIDRVSPKELLNYAEVCWVLKSENETLNSKGYKSKRPNGWEAAYDDCGIQVESI